VPDRCFRNSTDRAVNTAYENVREMERAQDCDKMCCCGVLFLVCAAVVVCEVDHAEKATKSHGKEKAKTK
jgi:hypothetical protein